VDPVATLEHSLKELPLDKRNKLSDVFLKFLNLARLSEPSPDDASRRAWLDDLERTLDRLTSLIVNDPQGVTPDLRVTASDSIEPTLAELEKRNALARAEQWHQAVRESLSTIELLEQIGVSRQRLEQLRKNKQLFGLQPPFGRGFFYPIWEFDRDGRPRKAIPAIIKAAEDARLDPLSLHQLMVSPDVSPEGPLMKALDAGQGDYVLGVIRASTAQGS